MCTNLTEAQILLDYKSCKTCCNVKTNFDLLQKKESKIHINVKAKVCSSGTIPPHLPQGSVLILGCPSHARCYQLPDRKYIRHFCFHRLIQRNVCSSSRMAAIIKAYKDCFHSFKYKAKIIRQHIETT